MDAVFNDMTFSGGGDCLVATLDVFCGLCSQLTGKINIRRILCVPEGAFWLFICSLPGQEATLCAQMGKKAFQRLKNVVYNFFISREISGMGETLVWDDFQRSAPAAVEHAIANNMLLVGLNSSAPWGALVHSAHRGFSSFSIMCVTLNKHLSESVFLRWAFAMEMLPFNCIRGKLSNHGHKHFLWQSGNAPTGWIVATKAQPAQFNPGMAEDGDEIQQILRQLLAAAIRKGKLTHHELNEFSHDTGRNIGATNGVATTCVKLYVTPQDEFHIRPE